jgi:hypothetical protein
VLIAGAVRDWPAMTRWSPEYFTQRFGDRAVPAMKSVAGSFYDLETGAHYEQVRVSDYVCNLTQGKPIDLYMACRVQEVMPELFDDMIRPPYCRDAGFLSSKLWYAASDTCSPLHRDLPENLYAQIRGRKRFLLVDRRSTRSVHRHSLFSRVPNCSPVDVEAPDLTRFPRFRDVTVREALLEPGDMLYIPSLWWHQARSIDTSMSVNLFWVRGAMVIAARAAQMFLRLRGLEL